MNKIILMGRLVRDPELKHTENGDKTYTKFTIAVQRNFKLSDGSREADFIPVRVWGKKAEIVCKLSLIHIFSKENLLWMTSEVLH